MSKILDPLVRTIHLEVEDAVSNKTIVPEERLWMEWKASDFGYSDDGVVIGRLEGTQAPRPDWSRASRTLQARIVSLPMYRATLDALNEQYPDQASVMADYLAKLVAVLISAILSGIDNPETFCTSFLVRLAGGPTSHQAKVRLNGVVLRSPSIQIVVGVRLRQPTRDDIETASPVGLFDLHNPMASVPHAIAEIEHAGASGDTMELQRKVGQLVAILRLFGVGSVAYSSYEMSSDSFETWGGRATLSGGQALPSARETYVIRREDEDNLRRFWQHISHALPRDIYDFQKQVSPLTLAYDRYSDAVLQNGIVERRIANIVMGLEALLLDEVQELSYRLGMRTAKVMSLIGKKPLEVRERIHDAYSIRNQFAHGGHLSYKQRAKLERKYGDLKKFMLPLFDYLRSLIVLMMSVQYGKEQVIDWIDDALIDQEKHDSLKSTVSHFSSLVSGRPLD